jgi:hypothetical protein
MPTAAACRFSASFNEIRLRDTESVVPNQKTLHFKVEFQKDDIFAMQAAMHAATSAASL